LATQFFSDEQMERLRSYPDIGREVHQIVAAADLDALDAALGELRAAGWPAPEHPDSGEDTEPNGRDTIADRLSDEVSWLRQCAGWLAHLDADNYPPAVNLRPAADWPDRAVVARIQGAPLCQCPRPGERPRVRCAARRPAAGAAPGYRPSNLSGSGPVRSFLFSTVMSSTSVADSSKSKMSMFSRIRSGVTDLGNTMSPRWMCQRSTT
jgi:hypothetical protein